MRQRVDGLRRGKKLDTDRVVARVQFAMAQHGHDTRRSGLFLRGKRAMFTLTAKPFIEVGAQLATTQSLTSRIGTYDRSDPDNEDTSAKPDPT